MQQSNAARPYPLMEALAWRIAPSHQLESPGQMIKCQVGLISLAILEILVIVWNGYHLFASASQCTDLGLHLVVYPGSQCTSQRFGRRWLHSIRCILESGQLNAAIR